MRESILELMERALSGAETLPPAHRADLYDAAAALLGNTPASLELGQAGHAASKTAIALREAESCQLTFTTLLRRS